MTEHCQAPLEDDRRPFRTSRTRASHRGKPRSYADHVPHRKPERRLGPDGPSRGDAHPQHAEEVPSAHEGLRPWNGPNETQRHGDGRPPDAVFPPFVHRATRQHAMGKRRTHEASEQGAMHRIGKLVRTQAGRDEGLPHGANHGPKKERRHAVLEHAAEVSFTVRRSRLHRHDLAGHLLVVHAMP